MFKNKRKHFIPDFIKKIVDKIEKEAAIIINWGHIDNPQIKPDKLYINTFQDVVEIASYLRKKSYKNVRLAILINDMYEFDKNPAKARRALSKRRKEYKKTGVYDLFPEIYKKTLEDNNFKE